MTWINQRFVEDVISLCCCNCLCLETNHIKNKNRLFSSPGSTPLYTLCASENSINCTQIRAFSYAGDISYQTSCYPCQKRKLEPITYTLNTKNVENLLYSYLYLKLYADLTSRGEQGKFLIFWLKSKTLQQIECQSASNYSQLQSQIE